MRASAALAGGRGLARLALRRPAVSRRLVRRLLVLGALALLLCAGYRFWLRDSSLVAVSDVTVSGLTTKDSDRVRSALQAAGRSMTTLHVDRDALEDASLLYPVVRGLEVRADFPHGLSIRVIEHHPAAIANLGGTDVPVAGDGTVLRGLPVEGRLPAIEAEGGVKSDRLAGTDALGAARVAGAVPPALFDRVERIDFRADEGLVVKLVEGPELIFGDGSRAEAKWIAAARVLADPDAEGATYIDLRIPGRPAAGGLPAVTLTPVAPAGPIATSPPGGVPAPGATTGVAPADPAAVPAAPGGTATAPAPATPGATTPPASTTPPATTAPAPGTASPPLAPAPTPPVAGGEAVGGAGAPPG